MIGFVFNGFKMYRIIFILQLIVRQVTTWHDLTNVNYHCWPYSASASNRVPFTSCPGIDIRWIVEPPDDIKVEQYFNTSYELILKPQFYTWAVSQGIFDAANGTGISDATQAQQWCETVVCPSVQTSTPENCCIHHVNVHSCPLSEKDSVKDGLCGPWIPPSGSIFTHSQVMVGPPTKGNWTSLVAGLYTEGHTSIIAHFKLAKMHIAVEKTVHVLPKTVCGDERCENEEGEDCSTCPKDCGSCPLTDWEIALIVIALVILVVIFLIIIAYFRYQKRKLLWDESWIISNDEIKEDIGLRGMFGSMLTVHTSDSRSSINTSSMSDSARRRQIFANTAIYNGRTVAVKKIHKNDFKLSLEIRSEVKAVREMDHPNLCKFVGGCIDIPDVAIVTEYCPKGSLNDVLLNDEIPLNWAFRFSLASDISRGMGYLHSRGMVHGRLTSSNCVVDDRWTVKVTDFGLPNYRAVDITCDEDKQEEAYKEKARNVYKAPEIRKGVTTLSCPGDVYSFSILLVEIANRNDPYGDEDRCNLPVDWKPPLPEEDESVDIESRCPCPFEYCTLIKDCWNNDPNDRPSFDTIKKTLYKINPNKLSAVDLIMHMMEKYSKHLESIVVDRTRDLVAEKQKTDKLLYSMLPKPVADQLRQGTVVNAESFDDCTIYFSDVVGFTTLSGKSTAMQVIALLNKLYTTFDEIIDQFDVYKVETIGDAYMVVSGVPIRTEFHAREISNMALEIVTACKKFAIPHLPDEPLQIRVGLHSGPVCTGVVGLKMPRYCLFGDTVNTASRMESNGAAYRIHISSSTHDHLNKIGGYKFECRGAIPIKGKGEMVTWWLLSQTSEISSSSGSSFSTSRPETESRPLSALSSHSKTKIVYVQESTGHERKDHSLSSSDSGFH